MSAVTATDGMAEVFRAFARDRAAGRRYRDTDTARSVAGQFAEPASEWDATRAGGRDDPLRGALDRGGPLPRGTCLEIGSGTGLLTAMLGIVFPQVISVDLSERMLHRLSAAHPRGCAPNRCAAWGRRPGRGHRRERRAPLSL